MRTTWRDLVKAHLLIGAAMLLVSCGGSDGPPPPPPAPPPAIGSATIGAAGGTVNGPDGVRLDVPAGALDAEVTIQIARDATGAPALPAGINLASAIYAITPHGTTFNQSASVQLPANLATAAGRAMFLMKAETGGSWSLIGSDTGAAATVRAGLNSLSYFAIGVCDSSLPPTTIFGQMCPSGHTLRFELLDSSGSAIPVSQDLTYFAPLPVVTITTPTTLTARLTWTRPAGTDRVDVLDTGSVVTGTGTGLLLSRQSGIVFSGTAPRAMDVNSNTFSATFTIAVDPSQVAGAGNVNGVVRNLWAQANYSLPRMGSWGGADWEFNAFVPIRIRYTGTLPTITQQPMPPSVSVVENNTFTLTAAATGPNLSYEWRYLNNVMDSAIRAAEGTNNQASYTSPAVPLAWNGRLYYVNVCTNRGTNLQACVDTSASPLTVTPFTQPVAFTTQPVARDILEGESTTFNAAVTGTPTPTLRWYYNVTCSTRLGVRICNGTAFADGAGSGPFAGATIGGSATATLNLGAVPLTAHGTTVALIASQSGSTGAASDVVALTVRARPVAAGFTQQLVSPRTVTENGSIDFSVTTSGTQPINYFWSINANSAMPGQITTGPCTGAVVSFPSQNVMRLTNVPLGCNGAVIGVGIENIATPAGTRPTSTASLNVTAAITPPVITQQPVNTTVAEGGRASVVVGYGGTLPIDIALQQFSGGVWVNVGTQSSSTCPSPCSVQTPALQLADNGAMFRVRLTNSSATAAESNPITVTVTIGRAPMFTTQPASVAVDANQTTTPATFSFAVNSDTGTFGYTWLVNGQPLADGSGMPANGVLQGATVSGAAGTGTSGTLTLANLPLAANGAAISVRVTRAAGGQTTQGTSNAATLTVNTGLPANALTATQIVAGPEWSMVLRPDRTVWAWGRMHRTDGTVQYANLNPADQALRPVRMYPSVLSDVRAISGWSSAFWALKGTPGSTSSRVLSWGWVTAGSDGRGGDGNGSLGSSIAPRLHEATPVEVLERVNNVPQPVDRVCVIAGGGEQLAMIRAIDSAGVTTDCSAGSAKTVWFVGSLNSRGYESTGVAFAMPGLPSDSPPAVIFTGQTNSGSPGLAIALEDGRVYGLGANPYGGFGVPSGGSGLIGGLAGPLLLPSGWGSARSFGMSFYYSLFVVRADGSVMASGYDSSGELGFGSAIGGSRLGPLPVLSESCTGLPCADVLTGVSAIVSTNTTATLALKNGQILGWGSPLSGLLGPGVTGAQPFPRPVPSTVSGFAALSAADKHALVIGPGNVVYAWGSGLRGALGDGVDGGTRTAPGMVTTGP